MRWPTHVAVESVEAAVDAIRWLRDEDAGRAGLVVSGSGHDRRRPSARPRWRGPARVDLVDGPAGAHAAVRACSPTSPSSTTSPPRAPSSSRARDVVAVTRDGDLLAAHARRAARRTAPSALEVQAALDEAARGAARRAHGRSASGSRLAPRRRRAAAPRGRRGALDRLHESDARMAAVAEQLGQLGAQARAARAEAERLQDLDRAARDALAADQAELRACGAARAPPQAEPRQSEAGDRGGSPAGTRPPTAPRRPARTRWRRAWRCGPARSGARPLRPRGAPGAQRRAERDRRERRAERGAPAAPGGERARSSGRCTRAPRGARRVSSARGRRRDAAEARGGDALGPSSRHVPQARRRVPTSTRAHRRCAPRRGGPRRAAAAHRGAAGQGGRGARRRPRRAGRGVRPGDRPVAALCAGATRRP